MGPASVRAVAGPRARSRGVRGAAAGAVSIPPTFAPGHSPSAGTPFAQGASSPRLCLHVGGGPCLADAWAPNLAPRPASGQRRRAVPAPRAVGGQPRPRVRAPLPVPALCPPATSRLLLSGAALGRPPSCQLLPLVWDTGSCQLADTQRLESSALLTVREPGRSQRVRGVSLGGASVSGQPALAPRAAGGWWPGPGGARHTRPPAGASPVTGVQRPAGVVAR